ncbi:MAG: thiamine pyrophosphate-dependent enzyme, partial [Candidatus Sungbacteria bacterium]|nr:thiamine pyrophosphate-dependent enzyme [Candidatus Sungbacteria bacterium]
MAKDMSDALVKEFALQIKAYKNVAKGRYASWRGRRDYYTSALDESLRLESLHVEPAVAKRLLEVILESRMLSLELINAYRTGEFSGALLLGIGQEAVGTGVGLAMKSHDVIARDHRSISAALARGTPSYDFWANHLMRSTGPTRGRDPNVHFADIRRNDLGFLASDMGVGAALVNGACWYLNKKNSLQKGAELLSEERSVGIAIVGDGATSQGIVHEAMNFAKAFPLPIVFVILNNQIACRTSPKEQHGDIDLANRAIGYEMPMLTVDGDNVFSVYVATLILLEFARMTNHPCMLHAITFRRSGHNETERTNYVEQMFDPKFLEHWRSPEKDPLRFARRMCEEMGFISEKEFTDLRNDVKARVDNAHEQARKDPYPLLDTKSHALIDPTCRTVKELAGLHPAQSAKKEMTMKEAIRCAMREAFTDDPALLMIGEDIGFPGGGVFELTAGLWDDIGRDRIKNVPLSEAAQGGFLVGAGLLGGRVILEYQFWNFFLAGANPILTLAATRPYLQGVSIPGVLRGPYGYAPQSNHYHESVPEAYLLKSLGIKVVIPSTPFMAKGLFASAVRDPDLVAFLEE